VRRVLIGVLTVCLLALRGLGWRQQENRATELAKQTAPFDWSGVTSRAVNIAAVPLTARDVGLHRAMNSLLSLARGLVDVPLDADVERECGGRRGTVICLNMRCGNPRKCGNLA
jgi:hypothetical protein